MLRGTMPHHDVAVVGGSYSGMAAALQLLRARRSVLVIDAGTRRNRFADHSHGFLGQDGVAPDQIVADARRQLEAYSGLDWVSGTVVSIKGGEDDFVVQVDDGASHGARRVLLATGVADQLPHIDGLSARWGRTVFHCPYCHGYELERGLIGVIATGQPSVHQAELLTEWGEVTFLTNAAVELNPGTRQRLEGRRIVVEEARIVRIEGRADVLLEGGGSISFAGLFTASMTVPATRLPEQLGCLLEETPMGIQVHTTETKLTSIPGVFACGDVAGMPHSISLAVGDGAMAGIQIHRSLVWPE